MCTYDRAADLDGCLAALGAQEGAVRGWRVTVVDNNSADATPAVVEEHRLGGRVPGLRCLLEREQGLTPARLRGVRESGAAFVAFVDDDCRVAPDWIRHALAFAQARPEVGAFGGRVIPDWGRRPPPHLARHGWLFAEQDHGEGAREVASLVGTGLVLNTRALAAVGWTERPFLADRIGRGTVSGGDVEIGLRLSAGGHPLWYVPEMRLAHRVAASRQRLPALRRLAWGLGAGAELVDLLRAPESRAWRAARSAALARARAAHWRSLRYVPLGRYHWRDWLIRDGFLAGQRAQIEALASDDVLLRALAGQVCPAVPNEAGR